MDILLILVCLVLVGSVFIPFYLFIESGKNEEKKLKGRIKELITDNNLKISESEIWGNSYIGIDTNQQKIFFLKFSESDCLSKLLDINSISDCQLMVKRKMVKIRNKKELVLERLDLEFSYKNGETCSINFYDENEYRVENFELARAEKWKKLLIGLISKVSIEKTAA